jgi:hypothetical protein
MVAHVPQILLIVRCDNLRLGVTACARLPLMLAFGADPIRFSNHTISFPVLFRLHIKVVFFQQFLTDSSIFASSEPASISSSLF